MGEAGAIGALFTRPAESASFFWTCLAPGLRGLKATAPDPTRNPAPARRCPMASATAAGTPLMPSGVSMGRPA